MLIYEYKLDGNQKQYAAIEEAMRITQFIRNKCLRKWMAANSLAEGRIPGSLGRGVSMCLETIDVSDHHRLEKEEAASTDGVTT